MKQCQIALFQLDFFIVLQNDFRIAVPAQGQRIKRTRPCFHRHNSVFKAQHFQELQLQLFTVPKHSYHPILVNYHHYTTNCCESQTFSYENKVFLCKNL